MSSFPIDFVDNTRPELKLNVSNEYVVSEGGNVFILVHASDPEGRSVDVSYSIEGSVFTRLSGSLLKIGPVFYRINLIIKALDPCGLEAVSAVVIGKKLSGTFLAFY